MKEVLKRLCKSLHEIEAMLAIAAIAGLVDEDFSGDEYKVYISMSTDLAEKIAPFCDYFEE